MTKLADTIGTRLRAARESKGMSIEDAAFETRIHAPYLRGLENDDYSGFASAIYAKSFLSLYSRYLGVDADEALRFFEGGNDTRLSGGAILPTLSSAVSSPAKPISRDARPVKARGESPGFAPVFLGLVVLALVVGIPVLWFLGKDAESINDVTSKAKSIAEATRLEIPKTAGTEPPVAPADSQPQAEPATSPVVAQAPVVPDTAAPVEDSGPRSVAADWVLDSTTPQKPAEAPAAPDAGKLAAVVTSPNPGIAQAPLRAVPSDFNSNSITPPSVPVASPVESDSLSTTDSVPSDSPSTTAADSPPVAASPLRPNSVETEAPAAEPAPTKPAGSQSGGPSKPVASVATPVALRATPLIAVPIATPTDPADGAETSAEPKPEEDPEEPPFVDPRNRFPRPLE
jgi:cytoskeletal protein RodZ